MLLTLTGLTIVVICSLKLVEIIALASHKNELFQNGFFLQCKYFCLNPAKHTNVQLVPYGMSSDIPVVK